MGEQQQAEAIQIFSRQHASGEVFEARDIEIARGMCPVLGRMSVEEAGLLLELEAMGKEQMTSKTKQPQKAATEGVTTIAQFDNKQVTKSINSKIVRAYVPSDGYAQQTSKIEKQPDVLLKLYDADRSENTIFEAEVVGIKYDFFVKKVASKPENSETDQDPKKTTLQKEIPSPTIVKQADPARPSPVEEATGTVLVIPGTVEVATQIIDPEPELHLVNLPELAEVTEDLVGSRDYDVIQEEDVIWLGAGLEGGESDVSESTEAELSESTALDHPETAVLRIAPVEFQFVVSVPELPAPVEEIETVMAQLVEALGIAQPEESTGPYQILKEITALPASLETTSSGATEGVEERLEKLFTKLFKEMDIEYTPQLIRSFVKLTQAHYLEEMLETVKEVDTKALPDETGTREFLQKLKQGLNTMKRASVQFYEIGKSVLQLYNVNQSMSSMSA